MILEYPPDIQYSEMKMLNFYRRASPDWRSKNYISLETGKVTSRQTADWNSPWDYVNNDPNRALNCEHAKDLFGMYKMVPPFCIDCWKVVVKPRLHSELIALRNLQREMATEDSNVWCKCGIDKRVCVPGLYGGYFYTNSKEDGLKRLKQVQDLVYQYIPTIEEMPVYLKRYCTEFENELGDSAKYKAPEYAERIQKFYFANMKMDDDFYGQAKLVKLEVYNGWIDFGWKFGTPEDRKEIEDTYNNGQPLYPKPRTYKE